MPRAPRHPGVVAVLALVACAALPAAAGADPVVAPPRPLAQAGLPTDEVLWNTIEGSGYVELYEYFLNEFPASRRAGEARTAIAILRGEIDPEAEAREAAGEDDEAASAAAAPGLDPLNLDIAEFQRALGARGCNAGIDDGIWGERTAGAAQRFADALGLDVDPSWPNVALFGAVLTAEGDVCGEI